MDIAAPEVKLELPATASFAFVRAAFECSRINRYAPLLRTARSRRNASSLRDLDLHRSIRVDYLINQARPLYYRACTMSSVNAIFVTLNVVLGETGGGFDADAVVGLLAKALQHVFEGRRSGTNHLDVLPGGVV